MSDGTSMSPTQILCHWPVFLLAPNTTQWTLLT